jgi:hypothetical protein
VSVTGGEAVKAGGAFLVELAEEHEIIPTKKRQETNKHS